MNNEPQCSHCMHRHHGEKLTQSTHPPYQAKAGASLPPEFQHQDRLICQCGAAWMRLPQQALCAARLHSHKSATAAMFSQGEWGTLVHGQHLESQQKLLWRSLLMSAWASVATVAKSKPSTQSRGGESALCPPRQM